jgi:carbonic anhydrase
MLHLVANSATGLVGIAPINLPPSVASARFPAGPTMAVTRSAPRFSFYGDTKPPALQDDSPFDADTLEVLYDNVPVSTQSQQEIIWELIEGNQRFMKRRGGGAPQDTAAPTSLVTKLVADALNPRPVKALVVSCARSYSPVDSIFDAAAGDLQHLRVCGNIIGSNDGAVGSIEFALARSSPKVLVVMANSRNDVIEAAVRMAMENAGLPTPASTATFRNGVEVTDLKLLEPVILAAKDAIMANPTGTLDELCEFTAKLNAYKSIENLLSSSRLAYKRVLAGELRVEAAYLDVNTGTVSMQGVHPSQGALLETMPTAGTIRVASDPPVPPDEAKAGLFSGNKRYATGNGGALQTMDDALMRQLDQAGQNPIAIILGCADSRAPIEILFDVRPGDLFVLRNAGNTCSEAKDAIIGSAEYAIGNLNTKLFCVTGHTKCGALTAAVNAAIAGVDTSTVGGSIGIVLDDIMVPAKEALAIIPDAPVADQIALAIKLNIYATMKKLIMFSTMVKEGIEKGDLQLIGAFYDIYTGNVEWLGDHPELEEIVGKPLPYWQWKNAKYTRKVNVEYASVNPKVEQAVQRLKRGNERFKEGMGSRSAVTPEVPDPFAIVIGGGEVRVPIEQMFDVQPGELIVQRVMGNIAGRPGGTLVNSIEFALARYDPKLLLVLGDSASRIVKTALEQSTGAQTPSPALRYVVDRVMVSAIRAKKQVEEDLSFTAAGRDLQIQRLTVELNVFYTIEQLLRSSIVRDAVRDGMEMQGAVLNSQTGHVEFIGQHPQLTAVMDDVVYAT